MSKNKLNKVAAEIIAVLLSLIVIIPFYMIVVNSFKDPEGANKLGLSFSHIKPEIIAGNYKEVFKISGLATAYKNSTIVTLLSVLLIVVISSMAGFIIQRRKQRVIELMNFIIIIGMTMPGFIVPTYFVVKQLGMAHSYIGICLVYAAGLFPLAVFLFTGFYKSIPVDLDESAIIDGCGSFRLFFKIILPLVKPVTATVTIICAMSIWNDFGTALFLLNSPKKFTVVLTVFSFYSQRKSDWNYLFADIVLISLPIVVLYILLQKYIVSGLTTGAIKG